MHCLSFFINKKYLCRHVPKVPYGSYVPDYLMTSFSGSLILVECCANRSSRVIPELWQEPDKHSYLKQMLTIHCVERSLSLYLIGIYSYYYWWYITLITRPLSLFNYMLFVLFPIIHIILINFACSLVFDLIWYFFGVKKVILSSEDQQSTI
jgi:hypothetical protein